VFLFLGSGAGVRIALSLNSYFNQEKLFMKEPDTPQGTVVLLAVFLLLTLVLWGNVYFTMLSRGATQ
jgi:Cytochrome c oxidase subunit IIa family